MFDMWVFIILLVLAAIANIVAVPKIIDFSSHYSDSRELKILHFSALVRSLLISIVACIAGAYAAPRVGLVTPLISSLLGLHASLSTLLQQMVPALALCVPILLGAMLLRGSFSYRYRTIFQYFSLPLRVRILQNGIAEEIVFRWGLMSTLAYFINSEFIADRDAAIAIAIVLAALASSLMHVSDLISFTYDHLVSKISALVLVNFWAALCYGWLFAHYGLTAAIACHILVVAAGAYGERMKNFFDNEEPGWSH